MNKLIKNIIVISLVLSLSLILFSCRKHKKHTYNIFDFDENFHWKICEVCKEYGEVGNHIFNNGEIAFEASISSSGIKVYTCIICLFEKEEVIPILEHDHVYGDYLYNDTHHYKECFCGEKIDNNLHIYDEGTIIFNPTEEDEGLILLTCNTCDKTKEEVIPKLVHVHKYGDYLYDEETHYKECDCGDIEFIGFHLFDDGIKINDNEYLYTCEICRYEKRVDHVHVFGSTWIYNEETHWKKCDYCEEINYIEFHDFNILDEKKATCISLGELEAECNDCGYCTVLIVDYINHEYDDFDYNDDFHWLLCIVCDEHFYSEEHEFKWIYDFNIHNKICLICGYGTGEEDHDFDDDGDCTICEYKVSELMKIIFKIEDRFGNYEVGLYSEYSDEFGDFISYGIYLLDGNLSYFSWTDYLDFNLVYYSEAYYRYISETKVEIWERYDKTDEFILYEYSYIPCVYYLDYVYQAIKYAILYGDFDCDGSYYVLKEVLTTLSDIKITYLGIAVIDENTTFIDIQIVDTFGDVYFESHVISFNTARFCLPTEHSLEEVVNWDTLRSIATCNNKATYYYTCSVCEHIIDDYFEYGELVEHNYSSEWSCDFTGHYYECNYRCGAKTVVESHEFDEGVIDGSYKIYTCLVCFYTKSEAIIEGSDIVPVDLDEFFSWITDLTSNYIMYVDELRIGEYIWNSFHYYEINGDYMYKEDVIENQVMYYIRLDSYINAYYNYYYYYQWWFYLDYYEYDTNPILEEVFTYGYISGIISDINYEGSSKYYESTGKLLVNIIDDEHQYLEDVVLEICDGYVLFSAKQSSYFDYGTSYDPSYDRFISSMLIFGEATIGKEDIPRIEDDDLNDFFDLFYNKDTPSQIIIEIYTMGEYSDNYVSDSWDYSIYEEKIFDCPKYYRIWSDGLTTIIQYTYDDKMGNITNYWKLETEMDYETDDDPLSEMYIGETYFEDFILYVLLDILFNYSIEKIDDIFYLIDDYVLEYYDSENWYQKEWISIFTMEFVDSSFVVNFNLERCQHDYNGEYDDCYLYEIQYYSVIINFEGFGITLPI